MPWKMSRVYIGRLPTRCSERDIERFFKGYGRLRDVVLKNGYGFVEFDNEKDADDAVYDLRGKELGGERIIVEHARLPADSRGGIRRGGGRDRRFGPPTRTEYRVIIENLSSRVSWQYLKDMMRKAGDVTYADAHKTARNDGIVEFSSSADMKEAIEKFDGYELYGRRLRVYEDRPTHHSRSNSRRSDSSGRRKYSNRSRSRDSYRRRKSLSPRRRHDRSNSSDCQNSEARDKRDSCKHRSPGVRSRSGSRRSESLVRERSSSHRSLKKSLDRDSRSPTPDRRNGSTKDEPRRCSRSQSGSDYRSRSAGSRSPARSRTPAGRSKSGSHHSRSDSECRYSNEKLSDREQDLVADSE